MPRDSWPQPSNVAVSRAMRSNTRPTRPEVALRSALHRNGLRFRKSTRIRLDGRWTQPDVTFPRARVAVFLDGCFWHSCPTHGTMPHANSARWRHKFDRNVARDRDTDMQLVGLGWTVVRAWEHEELNVVVERVSHAVRATTHTKLIATGARRPKTSQTMKTVQVRKSPCVPA